MEILLIFLTIICGIIAGMGMGGGTLLIPILTVIFPLAQQTAQGINLLVFIPCALFSLLIHSKNEYVNFKVGFKLILAGIPGSLIASFLAVNTDGQVLRKLFAVFLVLIGLYQCVSAIIAIIKGKKQQISTLKVNVFAGTRFK